MAVSWPGLMWPGGGRMADGEWGRSGMGEDVNTILAVSCGGRRRLIRRWMWSRGRWEMVPRSVAGVRALGQLPVISGRGGKLPGISGRGG